MKLIGSLLALGCVSADNRYSLKLKLCTENGGVKPYASGKRGALKIKFDNGLTYPIYADYDRDQAGYIYTRTMTHSGPSRHAVDFSKDGGNWAVTLEYNDSDIVCFEEMWLRDNTSDKNEVDIMQYIPQASAPTWTTDASKVIFLTNNCDPAWTNAAGNTRAAAQNDAFRQSCNNEFSMTLLPSADNAINECNDPTLNKCDDNADCTDTLAGYKCTCKSGFTGMGFKRDFVPIEGCTVDPSASGSSGSSGSGSGGSGSGGSGSGGSGSGGSGSGGSGSGGSGSGGSGSGSSTPKTTLICNEGDAVKMSVTMPKTLSPLNDLSELADWSDDGNGNYVASWASWKTSEMTEETRTKTDGSTYQVLVLTKASNAGCKKETVDGVTVCTKTGHDLSFKCEYSLADQTLDDQAFTVSGSDKEATAQGTGKLNYKLTVDKSAVSIGSKITATITPVSQNLVDATISKCVVKHKTNAASVDIIKANLKPTCELGAAIATGQGKEKLSFSWNAFKWTTTKLNDADVVEDQQVECTIELAKTAAVKAIQSCSSGSGSGGSGSGGSGSGGSGGSGSGGSGSGGSGSGGSGSGGSGSGGSGSGGSGSGGSGSGGK